MRRGRRLAPVAALVAVAAIGLTGCLQPGVSKAGVTPGYGPGLWRTVGNTNLFCSYSRLRSLTGNAAQDGITNDISARGPRYIQIDPSDAGFFSQGCLPWWRQEPPGPYARPLATPGQTVPGQGDYLVGLEVAPGVYWSQPDRNVPTGIPIACTWVRVRGFHGNALPDVYHDAIATQSSDHVMVVTIEPGDFGFRTNGCLPWTRIG